MLTWMARTSVGVRQSGRETTVKSVSWKFQGKGALSGKATLPFASLLNIMI